MVKPYIEGFSVKSIKEEPMDVVEDEDTTTKKRKTVNATPTVGTEGKSKKKKNKK